MAAACMKGMLIFLIFAKCKECVDLKTTYFQGVVRVLDISQCEIHEPLRGLQEVVFDVIVKFVDRVNVDRTQVTFLAITQKLFA